MDICQEDNIPVFLHAHLQVVYYNCVKFHKNSISSLVEVASKSCAYKVHAPPFRESIIWIISPFKFWTATIFLHAHLQAVYYNCVKFHLNPMSRLGGVALTSPSLHTERISEYKLNYLPFEILDSNHIPSCTSAGSVLQLCSFIRIQ